MRDWLKMALKLGLAVTIIIWLLKSGKLDFSLINQSFKQGYTWLFGLLILVTQDCLSSFRWRWLLTANSDKAFPFKSMIRVTWIGLFFNSFLPGAVTGDFIKLLYVRDLDKDMSKTYLVTSVLLDRILGLIGLLIILGIGTMVSYNKVVGLSPQMAGLIKFNLLLFAGAIGFLIFLFAPRRFQEKLLNLSHYIPFIGAKVHKTLESVWIIGDNKMILFKCIGLSMVLQLLNFGAFYILSSPFYSKPLEFTTLMTLIPIGFMAVAIPISPAGLGVGHVIFEKLFGFVGITGGANFFNLYFVALVFVNSFGIIPYLLSGKQHSLEEAEQFEESVNF